MPQAAFWKALEETDWSVPLPQSGAEADVCRWLVNAVAEPDEAGAAQRLSRMLLQRPTRELAKSCASLFAKQQRYETVPLLLRYAVSGISECTEALTAMKVPCAALAIIYQSSVYNVIFQSSVHSEAAPLATDFPIQSRYRARTDPSSWHRRRSEFQRLGGTL